MTAEHDVSIGGLDCLICGTYPAPAIVVIMLHGLGMTARDLAPFASSLGIPARYYFPQAPHQTSKLGMSWWPIDQARREKQLHLGPRDLCDELPEGRTSTRARLQDLVLVAHEAYPSLPILLAGFSQGAMMACDAVAHGVAPISALGLMSSSRVAIHEWAQRRNRFSGMPIFISHGRRDPNLSLAAGEALRDFLVGAGSTVTWHAFEGGHETPLVVWRHFRRFIGNVITSTPIHTHFAR